MKKRYHLAVAYSKGNDIGFVGVYATLGSNPRTEKNMKKLEKQIGQSQEFTTCSIINVMDLEEEDENEKTRNN